MLRQLKQEIVALKKENNELKADLNKSLDATFKLKEKLNAPTITTDTSALDKEELAKKVNELEYQVAMIQVEKKDLIKKVESFEKEKNDLASKFGFKDVEEAKLCRLRVQELEEKVKLLEYESGNSVLTQSSAQEQVPSPRSYPTVIPTLVSTNDPSTIPSTSQQQHQLNQQPNELHQQLNQLQQQQKLQQQQHQHQQQQYQQGRQQQHQQDLQQQEQKDEQLKTDTTTNDKKKQANIPAPPVVPDRSPNAELSTAGEKLEAKKIKQAERKHKAYFEQHKDEIDDRITLIQKAIRGHIARKNIIGRLKNESDDTTTVQPTSTPSSPSSSPFSSPSSSNGTFSKRKTQGQNNTRVTVQDKVLSESKSNPVIRIDAESDGGSSSSSDDVSEELNSNNESDDDF